MNRLCVVLLCLALSGCATEPRVILESVPTAVPVACQEKKPVRPTMPTENMPPIAQNLWLDMFVQHSTAEIEIREGYEQLLVAIIDKCTAPITP